jgi:hypothetical protein
MTGQDRGELQFAAVIGAVVGGVTGYLLSHMVESGGWLSSVRPSPLAWFFAFGLFVRECPSPLPAALAPISAARIE